MIKKWMGIERHENKIKISSRDNQKMIEQNE
jgi:hypothetical protein